MAIVFIGLGTNLGNRLEHIKHAHQYLGEIVTLVKSSQIIETSPLYVTDQPCFLNQVIKAETSLPPLELLKHFKDIETKEFTVIPVIKSFLFFFVTIVIPVAYFDKTFL